MKKASLILTALALLMVTTISPAAADNAVGELQASFHAGLSGGSAIGVHSDVADSVASPQTDPEGRIEPFGATEFICDQQIVGTWVFVFDADQALLDGWTNEFKLDGETLETVRTPLKKVAQADGGTFWWFAEGVPVLGVLDPGVHTVEWSFDDGGIAGTINTPVNVSAANC